MMNSTLKALEVSNHRDPQREDIQEVVVTQWIEVGRKLICQQTIQKNFSLLIQDPKKY